MLVCDLRGSKEPKERERGEGRREEGLALFIIVKFNQYFTFLNLVGYSLTLTNSIPKKLAQSWSTLATLASLLPRLTYSVLPFPVIADWGHHLSDWLYSLVINLLSQLNSEEPSTDRTNRHRLRRRPLPILNAVGMEFVSASQRRIKFLLNSLQANCTVYFRLFFVFRAPQVAAIRGWGPLNGLPRFRRRVVVFKSA